MLIDDGWLYLPQPCSNGSWRWTPIAWRDRSTGRVYSLIPGLSNQEAELQYVIAHTQQWICSEKGQRIIEQSLEEARKTIEELQKARRIDPADLRIPMTI